MQYVTQDKTNKVRRSSVPGLHIVTEAPLEELVISKCEVYGTRNATNP